MLESDMFYEDSQAWNGDENNLKVFNFVKANQLLVSVLGNSEPYDFWFIFR